MNRRRAIVIGSIVAVSVSIAIFSYYYFMPAWVYVERVPDRDDPNIVTITDNDIASYPILERLILKADDSSGITPSRAIENTSVEEANEVANLLDIHSVVSDDRGIFIYKGKTYYLQIFIQYGPPGLL